MSLVWPIMARPTFASAVRNSASLRFTRKPGIASSLSSVPPEWPRPRPDIIGTTTPHAAGRVLVDLRARDVGQVEPLARVGHRPGEVSGFSQRHPAPENGHEQRG